MRAKTLLIVGSGPGIALKTALLFASRGFTHIALISRTQSNLDKTASSIAAQYATVDVSTHACDVGNTQSLTSALAAVEKALSGPPEVILFNAANVSPSSLGHVPASRLVADFSITTAALYTTATTLLPKMSEGNPTLLITGGYIYHTPFPPLFSLSASKASQFNLSGSLAQVYGPLGVHVATVVINGTVEEEGRGR
jgi:short-subunit dehydrogenase